MKTIIISFSLFISFSIYCVAQNSEADFYNVGFRYYKTFDTSRQYVTKSDTTFRPLLIHHWYPTKKDISAPRLSFKDYIDLIAIRDDYNKPITEVNAHSNNFINAYLGFAKQHYNIDTSTTTQNVLNHPVKAIQNAPMIDESFPLIIYAPSNSKSSVQNVIICETLASNGFNVISVGSAGTMTLKRTDEKSSTEAQVLDMEFILKYFKDALHFTYSDLGLFGFSSGSIATALFQMRNKEVNAILSLDGGHEYFSYINLFGLQDFNLNKVTMPYCLLTNNIEDISIYPYYNSIVSTEKFMFEMPHLDHNGFVSYWKFFDMCSSNTTVNPLIKSYDVINETALKFFMTHLKTVPNLHTKDNTFTILESEYILKDTSDNASVSSLLNTVLSYGIDTAILEMAKNKDAYLTKENEINILGKMFIDKDISTSIRLYLANVELHPNSWQAYYKLGFCYKKANNLTLAKEALKKAIEMQPNNPDVLKLMEEVYE
ncbi:MAG: tetratricopeptide repeat protein [Aureibaculum sp.]|nr:tetratricopeptide repeat protein [Aureibaculum sp.]